MKRFLMDDLIKWKNKKNRKPLLLTGARQVGKTWLAREFGRKEFEDFVYINFDREKRLHDILNTTLDPKEIISLIRAVSGKEIVPEHTLIIFDEIQEEPRALSCLKYFCEDAPEYAILATGSFMGIALHQGTSFPVGKVDRMQLYPMNYREFLCALGYEELDSYIKEQKIKEIGHLKKQYIDLLRAYYAVGGMPEVVSCFADERDYVKTRERQLVLLDYYKMDFSKHAEPRLVQRLNQIWDSIPSQLAKENRKFIFGKIAKGARSKDFELALQWLSDCGLIHIVHRVSKAGMPLKAYEDLGAFKIYLLDVGLLCALGNLPVSSIANGNTFFEEFKGAISEQYVLTQLISDMYKEPFYYSTENSTGEIDFIIQDEDCIVPIEVKAEENLQAKSLKEFVKKHPGVKGMRISMSDYREQEHLINLPLYAFMGLMDHSLITTL